MNSRLVREALVFPARTLLEVCAHLTGKEALPRLAEQTLVVIPNQYPDVADVKPSRRHGARWKIAAAGQHSLLILPPRIPVTRGAKVTTFAVEGGKVNAIYTRGRFWRTARVPMPSGSVTTVPRL